MTFDTRTQLDRQVRWVNGAPARGAADAELATLDPDGMAARELHVRVNAYEDHWLRRMVREDMSSLQRVARMALREAINQYRARALGGGDGR